MDKENSLGPIIFFLKILFVYYCTVWEGGVKVYGYSALNSSIVYKLLYVIELLLINKGQKYLL